MTIFAQPGDDDTRLGVNLLIRLFAHHLVLVFSPLCCRVDGDDDSSHGRNFLNRRSERWPVEHPAFPERILGVFQQFGQQFLLTERRAFVALGDEGEERARQVFLVVVSRSGCQADGRVIFINRLVIKLKDVRQRLGRRADRHTRVFT